MTRFDVGIDGYNLALPNGTGVATYGYVLTETLRASGHRVTGLFGVDAGGNPAMREVLFYDRLGQEPPTPEQRRRRSRRIRRTALRPFGAQKAQDVPNGRVEKRNLADRLPAFDRLVTTPHLFEVAHRHFQIYGRFLKLRLTAPPAIMHWTYPVPITLEGAANIYTFHDLVPLRLPYTTLDVKRTYRRLLAACARNGAHICTVSEASRADILWEFGLGEDRVTNCYQASPLAVASDPDEDARTISNIFDLPHRGYYLHFGAIEPKKNIGRLLEAYLSTAVDAPLVMTGGRGWQAESELRLIEADAVQEQRLRYRVRRLEHLSRPLLAKLVRGARAVLFPSIQEGFGLPVLEAMQLGTPVLTSNSGALAEVAGNAALLVDPYDIDAIAEGILRLDRDETLRAELSSAGPGAAARFSRQAFGERLEAMYARVNPDRHGRG